MEQDIKNFDRSIEKIVHEQEIAPPFGVWNRISAELDALPAGESAPVKTLIPKRALTGIIAAAIVLGVSVGSAYIMNNVFIKDKTTLVVNAPQKTTNMASAAVNAEPVTKPANIISDENTVQPAIAEAKHNHHNTIAKAGKGKTNMPLASASPEPIMSVNALAPCTIKSVSSTPGELAQAFYFPPVDRTISDNGAPEKIVLDKDEIKIAGDDNDDGDKKVKSSEQKIKFHHKKRKKFNYGILNRF